VLCIINSKERQQHFINEIHRVLKPGRYFCFLENCKASWIHSFARKKFVSWGNNCRYITFEEMKDFLSRFQSYEIQSKGFLTVFVKPDRFKCAAYMLDKTIIFFIPKRYRYMMYGIATK